jgi:putative MATE family efflux protein
MNGSNELGTESVLKLLLKFSIPSMIGMLVNVLYSVVDRIFVGRWIGSLPLSGVAVTFPISNIIMAFGMLAGIGAAAAISIRLGQNKKDEAERILGNTFVLLIIFSLFISVVGIMFLETLLKVLGASPDIMPYAKQFAGVLLLGVLFQNIGFGLNSIIRSQGSPKFAMTTMIIGAVVNVVVNPILIFIFDMGVTGSALSTVIAQAVSAIWTLQYFIKGKGLLRLKKENMRLDLDIIKQIIAIGMSPFVMQLAASVVTVTFNKSLEHYGGSIAIGALALINSIAMLILMPMFGINQGVQPIIGYNYGAKNYGRVKEALKYAAIGATIITTTGFIFVQLFPVQIMSVFNSSDPELLQMSSRGLRIFLSTLPMVGVAIICTNYYQAVAKAKLSMFLSLLRQVILLIPLVLFMPKFFGLDGVWMAQAIADIGTTITVIAFILYEMKKISSLEANKTKEEAEVALEA